MKQISKIIIISLILFLQSCERKNNYSVTIKENGTKVIRNKNHPFDPEYSVNLKYLFTIANNIRFPDVEQGPSQYIVNDHNKNTFIYNYKDNKIRKYDDHGKLVLEFAGRGYGPGEIKHTSNMTIDNDTIKVYMEDQSKFNYYDLDGKYIRSILFDRSFNNDIPKWFDKDKFNLMEQTYTQIEKNTQLRYTSYSNYYKWGKEIALLSRDNNDKIIKVVLHESLIKTTRDIYATLWLKHSYKNGKIYYAENSQDVYRFHVFDSIGNNLMTVNKDYKRVKYPLAVKAVAKMVNPNFEENSINYIQSISDIQVDKNGFIWVRSYEDMIRYKYINCYEIFNSDGVFLNKIDLGKYLSLKHIENVVFKNDIMYVYADKKKGGANLKLYVYDY